MDKVKRNLLEDLDCIAILVGFITGVGILALPNAVVKDAKQDGWISVIIGGTYPLIMALLAIYYVKKHPNENILILSKIYLGNILGTICNILFIVNFGAYLIFILTGVSNVFRVYVVPFLTPVKIFIPTILAAFYLTHKGIKVLVRINKIALYFLIILLFMLASALQYGNYLNMLPVFGGRYKNILRGSMESAYVYGGMEAIFLFYPIVKNKNRVKSIVLKALFISMGIYTCATFICIYSLGYKVTSKALWPVLLVTEGINLPILNSFRLLFLVVWSIVIFKVAANYYYAFTVGLTHVIKIRDKQKIDYITIPLIICICLKVGNEVERRNLVDYIIPKVTLFNIVYVSFIGLLIFIKDRISSKICN
ncbi:GerAB/ArcD/ProY family transporter [Clostridium thailandense]|uniref:GerAB/ArcD/ProY family transporter n=1 Tax=Clostridium thailandense TaxID=2794346 RepID=UPI00398A1660